MTGNPPTPGPTRTSSLTEFSISTQYDKIHLVIGDTLYFVYPEIAGELGDALKRHAAIVRPEQRETGE